MSTPSAPRRPRWVRILLGSALGLILVAGLALAVLLTVAWPRLEVWRPMLVAQIERQLGQSIRIDALQPGWESWHPVLRVEGIRIEGQDGLPRFEADSAYARISWRGLLQARPRFAVLRLERPRLVVERLAVDRYAVAGVSWMPPSPGDPRALDWLLSQGELSLHAATVTVRDHTGALAPFEIDNLSLSLSARGWTHRLKLDFAHLGEASGAGALTAEFSRTAFSAPSTLWRGTGQMKGSVDALNLASAAAIARTFGLSLPPAVSGIEGRLALQVDARFAAGHLRAARVETRGEALTLTLDEGRVRMASVEGELRLDREETGGHRLRVSRLSAVDAAGFALATQGDVDLRFAPDQSLLGAWARLKSFDAASAWLAVRRLPLPVALRARLQAIEPVGRVRDLTLRWVHPDMPDLTGRSADRADALLQARQGQPRFELSAAFDALGLRFAPTGERRWPSVAQLSGAVTASESGGRLTLASAGALVSLPAVFEDPILRLDRLDADLEWTRTPADLAAPLILTLHQLSVRSPDARGTAQGQWRGGAGGPGTVDGSARLEAADARRVARYLPLTLPAAVRQWVDRALVAGRGDEVRFRLRGDLRAFPFRDPAEGEFSVTAAVRDLTLAYAPGWPALENLRGEARFDGLGMSIRIGQGDSQGLRLAEAQARIADWREGVLMVDTRVNGTSSQALRFVAGLPAPPALAALAQELTLQGDARGTVRLRWALRDPSQTPRVSGSVDLLDNTAAYGPAALSLSGASGRVDFSERGAQINDLRGQWLGGPVRMEARLGLDAPGHIEATGTATVAALQALAPDQPVDLASGRIDYRLGADLGSTGLTLQLSSSLQGLSLDLPAPLRKEADEVWPLQLSLVPMGVGPTAGDRLELRLREEGRARVDRVRDPASGQLVIRSAGLGWNIEPELSEPGVSVRVEAPVFDLDAWRRVAESALAPGASSTASPTWLPDRVALVADALTVSGRTLNAVVLGATRDAGRWFANLASREISGHFEWRDARPGERIGTLSAHFARLELPRTREAEVEAALSASPEQLPGLDLVADELILGNRSWGRLELGATNGGTAERPVWTLDRLNLTQPAARLQASGLWALAGDTSATRRTTLEFQLDLDDAGRLLDGFGFEGAVHAGRGALVGALHWQGSPIGFDVGSLAGEMKLDLQRGEFLKIDPGAAKLIGVLNMQSLPKRLSGDFRDLFGNGFAFDTLTGGVHIEAGRAYTEDLLIQGLQARVSIRGEADLKLETQRLTIDVLPQINAGLASIAVGAMVNPIVGLGSFAAQYLFKSPVQQALSFEIDVNGSWLDPAVSEARRKRLIVSPTPAELRH